VNFQKNLNNPIFKIVGEISDKLNISSYVVGGWVRDMLLDRKRKVTDIDFVCIGSGIELAKNVAKELKGAEFKFFKNFGTAMVNFNGENYEFVGARKESYRDDSRKPLVEDGSLDDDQNRRDFTINAMSIQLNKHQYGNFIDPFDGIKDLERKIIKTPLDPDITFSDDPLRMMRAVRFASELNFIISEKTLNAISRNAKRLSIISQERITDELNKIILSEVPSQGFKILFNTKLLHEFFIEFTYLQGVEIINNHAHKDNFYHTLEVLDNISLKTSDLWLRWAAILHDIAKPQTKKYEKIVGWTFHAHEFIGSKMTPKIFKKLKLPLNHKMQYVKKLVSLHLRPIVLAQEVVTDSAIRRLLFDAGNDIEDLMTLCDADITSKNPNKVKKYLSNFQLVRKKLLEVEEKDRVRNFQPPVDGNEIMEMFVVSSGKQIGLLKHAIKEAILDGIVKNEKTDAIEFLKIKAKELNIEIVK
jgi:poly(A) polymerase|tara:strand:+ start:11408 stop:12826 length:1419 start_codon:yes stop_codon:yes gene_type:complete